ncbi:alkaline phosphatase D family protein [Nocardioides rubriscoriae]|uniref:alkaline phosphatase D family protein n=1 Tax=Nocardioides rubriscoriae TaxID=642762 RepID=UPI001FE605D8|nr:alkaline phosphatase D family protein [Nocardioides rubriscoriae]
MTTTDVPVPDRPRVSRRTVTGALGAVGAAAPLLPGLTPAQPATAAAPRPRHQVFAHGVASGDPLPHAVVLWTRVTPTPDARPGSQRGPQVRVTWEVATDRRLRRVVRRGTVVTSADRDHTVKVDARGLRPATRYYYRFTHAGVRSPVGRTRTAPAATADPGELTFGVVSCSNYPAGYFASYRHLAARDDLDAVIHLGDYLYEYGNGEYGGERRVVPDHETVSLADYRQRHAHYKQDPDLKALHAQHPMVAIWDDHEIADNSWRDGANNHDPSEGSFRRRKARAHRAYDEWMPVRLDGTAALGDGARLYRHLQFGRLADLTLMDLRSYRDEQAATGSTGVADPARTITGRQQLDWVKRTLAASDATWKLVGTSVMIAPLKVASLPAALAGALGQLAGTPVPGDVAVNTDQWDGYTDDRRELFAHIVDDAIGGVVCLTGDIHTNWANELPIDTGTYPLTGTVGVEFVINSVTSDNFDEILGAPTVGGAQALMAANPHMKYVNLDDHGYGVLSISGQRVQMDFFVLDDKLDARSDARWDAGWLTRRGSGRLQEADGPVRRP